MRPYLETLFLETDSSKLPPPPQLEGRYQFKMYAMPKPQANRRREGKAPCTRILGADTHRITKINQTHQ